MTNILCLLKSCKPHVSLVIFVSINKKKKTVKGIHKILRADYDDKDKLSTHSSHQLKSNKTVSLLSNDAVG